MAAHRIRQGDIFWLDNCEPLHGDVAKRRPVIVVTPSDVIDTSPTTLVVACTSTVFASDLTAIELPSRRQTPQTKTGLTRRTWAIPAWLLPVRRDLLVDYVGHVPASTLRKLLEAIATGRGGTP